MRLENFFQASKLATDNGKAFDYGIEAIAADEELTRHIQECLVWLKFLDPPVDGKFGPISTDAFIEFQELISTVRPEVAQELGFLSLETARALIETAPEAISKLKPKIDFSRQDLAASLIKYMVEMNYRVSVGDRKYNIVYVEGMNADGTLNSDARNQFNDLRLVIEIPKSDFIPVIRGKWEGTTEPGTHFTLNPLNELGAARIAFGQYKAWRVGTHRGQTGADPHEALIQHTPVSVYRDKNQDFIRPGDFLDTGNFAINQHWGYDLPRADIGMAGAGCLVGRTRQGHREFMALLKQDRRYERNNNYLFLTTVIAGDDLFKEIPRISGGITTNHGIDVSNHNGNSIDWRKAKGSGVVFAFAKATEGVDFTDKYFDNNWERMKDAGIIRGAYHFFLPLIDSEKQAQHFLRVVGKIESSDLPPVLDLEHYPDYVKRQWEKTPSNERIPRVQQWLDIVESVTGRKPIIYTSYGFWTSYMGDTQVFAKYPLWIANYTNKPQPLVPANNWGRNGWNFWQYTETGAVPGVQGKVDRNHFNGSFDELTAFVETITNRVPANFIVRETRSENIVPTSVSSPQLEVSLNGNSHR
ncbi:peptidoglycan binding domain-containing protein [Calothrix sp. NIES-4071]|nr:peptidoglycan binding domain-containing protein [Calothrix sp. NIES-4071]BAZ58717.1 peptidoglycan binding domain-containing protein [Calothrix sp. NIES-4105]